MNVKEVLAVFSDPSETEEDSKILWMLVSDQNNRNGYIFINTEKHPSYSDLLQAASPFATDETLKRAADLLQSDHTIDTDFSKRPRIEDASPAMQNLFDNMESCDAITYYDEVINHEWENIGLSRKEYEEQIDMDIEQYGLEEIVRKGSDDALYSCYGEFLCAFSKPGGKELSAPESSEESGEISSLIPDGGNPVVSISFIPVDFQRDKEAPFRICEIMDRSEQDNPCVTYVVVRDGKVEALFTASGGKGQLSNHAFYSALDYIAEAYHDDPALALENFDGYAYAKKYYEVALFSNPATRFQHSPMALDAHWKKEIPDSYSTSDVFGETLINGELSVNVRKELETVFNESLEVPNFRFDDALISQLDIQPPITEVRVLENNPDIVYTPLYAAAQYEWEQERTRKIFDATGNELFSFLSALDAAMEKFGPTRASLDCFSEMLNDLCYGREEKMKEVGVPLSSSFGSSKSMESVYISCHKVLKSLERFVNQGKNSVWSI